MSRTLFIACIVSLTIGVTLDHIWLNHFSERRSFGRESQRASHLTECRKEADAFLNAGSYVNFAPGKVSFDIDENTCLLQTFGILDEDRKLCAAQVVDLGSKRVLFEGDQACSGDLTKLQNYKEANKFFDRLTR